MLHFPPTSSKSLLSSEMILSEMDDIDPHTATGAPLSHAAIATTTLTALPTEIIHQIATHIPTSGLVALKLTAKQLFHQLPNPPQGYMKTASDCEKRAIRRYVGERCETSAGRRKCILCDGMMPVELFFREEPVCKWHEGWFERVLEVRGLPRSYADGVLERQRRVRVLCGHCKQIRGWDVERCPCEETGECESCGMWEVECRIRLVDVAV